RKECSGTPSDWDCGSFEAEYDGKPREMRIEPVAVNGLPWAIVVYSNSSELEQQKGRVLAEALSFFAFYVLAIAATLWILYVTRHRWWLAPSWSEVPARLACLFAGQLFIIISFSVLL